MFITENAGLTFLANQYPTISRPGNLIRIEEFSCLPYIP